MDSKDFREWTAKAPRRTELQDGMRKSTKQMERRLSMDLNVLERARRLSTHDIAFSKTDFSRQMSTVGNAKAALNAQSRPVTHRAKRESFTSDQVMRKFNEIMNIKEDDISEDPVADNKTDIEGGEKNIESNKIGDKITQISNESTHSSNPSDGSGLVSKELDVSAPMPNMGRRRSRDDFYRDMSLPKRKNTARQVRMRLEQEFGIAESTPFSIKEERLPRMFEDKKTDSSDQPKSGLTAHAGRRLSVNSSASTSSGDFLTQSWPQKNAQNKMDVLSPSYSPRRSSPFGLSVSGHGSTDSSRGPSPATSPNRSRSNSLEGKDLKGSKMLLTPLSPRPKRSPKLPRSPRSKKTQALDTQKGHT